jgi:hypothetical protein
MSSDDLAQGRGIGDRARPRGLLAGLLAAARALAAAIQARRRKRTPSALPLAGYALLALGLFALTALALAAMGRAPICECGIVRLWQGEARGVENSQQIADWYSLLHVVYGMLIGGLMWLTSRHWPKGWLFLVAVASAAVWEIVENTPFMIARFGQGGLGPAYAGDSILNALSDMLFMLAGFWLALRLPFRLSVALALALELGVGLAIRDSLMLNAIMLLHPVEAIRTWQMAG